jgi:hypothetical protein
MSAALNLLSYRQDSRAFIPAENAPKARPPDAASV